jgi:DNA-binding HxlR family transcriptional regulator
MARSYHQFCGLAHALDLIGERWTLLIVRELLAGPRRYTDLKDGLLSIPTNLLAARLRELQDNGLLARRRLPAPASSVVVYELTDEGERLGDAILELTRWGMRTLPADAGAWPFRARWLVLALRASFDPRAARGVSESYELCIEGDDVVSLEISDGEGAVHVGPARDPAVRISADAETLAGLLAGALDGAGALARGARVEGEPAALERMRAILPPQRA